MVLDSCSTCAEGEQQLDARSPSWASSRASAVLSETETMKNRMLIDLEQMRELESRVERLEQEFFPKAIAEEGRAEECDYAREDSVTSAESRATMVTPVDVWHLAQTNNQLVHRQQRIC